MPIRVYKLAKELGVTSKDVMAEAMNHGIEVQNHMGSLTEAQANMIRAFLYVAPPKTEAKPVQPAKKVVAPAKAETPTEPVPEAPTQPVELAIVSPPALAGTSPTAARTESETAAPIPEPAVEAAPELSVSMGDIAASIINPPASPKAEAPDDAAIEATEAPVISPVVTPSVTPTVTAKAVSAMENREPTRELPRRRQATILGHKELPREAAQPKARTGDRAGQPPATPGEGMIQTKSVGSKRTFVRAPQRGGGGPRGFRGGGGGGFGGGRRGGGGPGGGGRRGGFSRPRSKGPAIPVERPTSCQIQLPITVKDLSAAMGVKSSMIIEQLLKNHGMLPSINTTLDGDTVELIGLEFECEITVTEAANLEKQFVEKEVESYESEEDAYLPRAPIVTFLGHVDHGKTSLLDHIRKTRVADREHGGITQHIGAYRVNTPTGDVVFLDTPGHQAFTAMRARGANVTDVVVLVVAADDGVQPQTEEAVQHAQAAETPIVVAINKIDKPEANVMQVKQQLSGLGLQPEDWGGETVCVELSAQTGQGVDELLEYLGLVSEMLDLKADPVRPAAGTVIEALQKKGEGNVARVVITDGTMRRGDSFLCGHVFGKVKAIRLPDGKVVKEAGPAWPVEIPGLSELPAAGDKIFVVKDVNKARQLAEERQRNMRDERLASKQASGLENLLKQASTGQLNLVVKADTAGSLEVLRTEIMNLKHEEIEPKLILTGVGGITEADVGLADASNAVVMGFHVTDNPGARKLADEKGIEIRHYTVIYKLLDELKDALEGELAPEERETITGHLEVLKTFKVSKVGTIAGCIVQDGVIRSSSMIRLTRDGILIHEGKLASLRHVKDDVRVMKESQECGVRLDGYDDVKVGDIFEPYEIEKVKRKLGD